MHGPGATTTITARLADTFYTEALLLADETRAYLDAHGAADRAAMSPHQRVAFACESLNATTRLMQVIAWLLSRKSASAEPGPHERTMLAAIEPIEPSDMAVLPPEAHRLIGAGIDLYDRVRRLDEGTTPPPPVASPALALIQRLERSL